MLIPGNIYTKLEDDVIFLGDDAMPHMVSSLLGQPDAVVVSANIVYSPEGN